MNRKTVNHHYLPRNYLKGFTDKNGAFFVYDKLSGKIFQSSPNDTFFQKNLNTVTFPNGRSSDFMESLYATMENQSWGSLDRIRASNSSIPVSLDDKMNLFVFLAFLHWRLPNNIQHAEQLSNKAFNTTDILGFFTIVNKDGSAASSEILNTIKKSPTFRKVIKLLLPFAPFYNDSGWYKDLLNWKFLYSGDGEDWYIVGDCPIVTDGVNDQDPINCLKKFTFPVSGRILLINSPTKVTQKFPAEIVLTQNIALIERSQRFVACPKKDFLEAMIELYQLYVTSNKQHKILGELFDSLLL